MNKWFLVALGSGLGGILRYGISTYIYHAIGKNFPYGTLVVNVLGCFLIGILFVFLLERVELGAEQLRAFLLIGCLGGVTTFSSFSIETINLFENGETLSAALNVMLSVIFCLVATSAGVHLGRLL